MHKVKRLIYNKLLKSLENFPATYIAGPRQSGKTTLAKYIATTHNNATYISFDDLQTRQAAIADPTNFLERLSGSVILDEIQLVPALFRPLKIVIDNLRQSNDKGVGKFLLTGSASVMALPQLADALVGRMVLHHLLPFSINEVLHKHNNLIDAAFENNWQYKQFAEYDLIKLMRKASYPEISVFEDEELRFRWCDGYINTILQRDIKHLMQVDKLESLPKLLNMLAAQTGGLLNNTALSQTSGLNHITCKRYSQLLEGLFLTHTIPAYTNNLTKRLIKSPKVYINDINILCYLLNVDLNNIKANNPILYGQIVENYVALELLKQLNFSNIHAKLYHYRSTAGNEVDFILEGPENKIVAIEVKSKSKVYNKDVKQLKILQNEMPEKFIAGIVFYSGTEAISFSKNIWALPLTVLG